jgi:hypothetical protein
MPQKQLAYRTFPSGTVSINIYIFNNVARNKPIYTKQEKKEKNSLTSKISLMGLPATMT